MAASCLRTVVFNGLRGARNPTVVASIRAVSASHRQALLLYPASRSAVIQRTFNLSPVAYISTSQKSKVVTTADKVSGDGAQAKPTATSESLEEKDENWISFGYSLVDRDEDEWAHHLLMFCAITFMFCWGTFFMAYYPDFKNQAWAQREAYLELERRESAGLPLIDPNMIPVDNIDLPTDDELADFDIII